MDTKWLEDFVSLARTRSFSRSAVERHVTQSAFSRRIQSLETWVGVPLVDRTRHPATLTAQGRQFRETADETLRQLYAAKAMLSAGARADRQTVAIAALHTLALAFFPRWFRAIEERAGALGSRLLPDDFHNCLEAVSEGDYDFLLTFHHPDVPIPLDPDRFPHVVVGTDSLVAVHSPSLSLSAGAPLPMLSYSANSFLGRVAASAQARADFPSVVTAHVNENAMAEALKLMATEGHGIAWLPRSLATRELAEGSLVLIGTEIPLTIRLYRKADHKRGIVAAVWSAAIETGVMQIGNDTD